MRVICGMLIGRGESLRWLDRTLRLAADWADQIVVRLDDDVDHDTEAAVACAEHLPRTIHYGATRFAADESAARNELMATLDDVANEGDLIVILDADEQVVTSDGSDPREVLDGLPTTGAWGAEFMHVWAPDGNLIRVDGGWRPHYQARIYRHSAGGRIQPRQLACGAVPEHARHATAAPQLRVIHWGYARPEDRQAKHARYMTLDGGRFHSRAHLESILATPTLEPTPWP
jgi:hypothetical protein